MPNNSLKQRNFLVVNDSLVYLIPEVTVKNHWQPVNLQINFTTRFKQPSINLSKHFLPYS